MEWERLNERLSSPQWRKGASREPQINATTKDQLNHSKRLGSSSDSASSTIVQFSSPIFFVTEEEGEVEVGVMRLGSTVGTVSCYYYTVDGSGKQGDRYEECEGDIQFGEGEFLKMISIPILKKNTWCTTQEFKISLCENVGCELGAYLHTCRVKVMDDTQFPSDKYAQADENANVGTLALFWEYVKMNGTILDNMWRTIVCILFDQLQNAYLFFKLIAMSYMLNTIFHDVEKDPDFTIDQRLHRAVLIGLGYIIPMLVLHLWELARIRIDVYGRSVCFLQQSLLTRYLNYNEDSREMVTATDVQLAVREDCADLAEGYMAALSMLQLLGKLLVVLYFMLSENPKALPYAIIMPGLMLVYGSIQNESLSKASEQPDDLGSDMQSFVADVAQNYNLVADYMQRPKINEMFQKKTDACRIANMAPEIVKLNNSYFTKWLGPVFVGVYIITQSHNLLTGQLGQGTFVATLSVFGEISGLFSEGYAHLMKISSLSGCLAGMIETLNLPTDLKAWKTVNRKRREATRNARNEILATNKGHPFPSDLLELSVSKVGFSFRANDWALHNVNLSVPQGKLISVSGTHGQGRNAFLKLIAHKLFPTEGEIFIPMHLRILHVSLEPWILKASIMDNLCFGIQKSPDETARIHKVLEMIGSEKLFTFDSDQYVNTESRNGDSEDEGHCIQCCKNDDAVDLPKYNWMKILSHTDRVRLHLARALVMNPEVMVFQRPLQHFNDQYRKDILDLLCQTVKNRGLALPEESVSSRRPRTIFVSVENNIQADRADVIWQMEPSESGKEKEYSVKQIKG